MAVTVNLAVLPTVVLTDFGWVVIVGLLALVTVRVAASEIVVPARFVTLQRYW